VNLLEGETHPSTTDKRIIRKFHGDRLLAEFVRSSSLCHPGRGGSLSTCGRSSSSHSTLAMVDEDLGPEIANVVARSLVVFIRRAGGQSQFSPQLAAQTAERAPIRELQGLIAERPDGDLSVPALARRAGMSERNFARVFSAETGVPPATYVEQVRVDTARRLLETSRRSIDQVASSAGFGTPEALRRAFARRLRLSPREYRARFGRRAAS